MKCPYCNNEMQVGYIYSRDDINFTPEYKKPSIILKVPKEYEIQLVKGSRIKRVRMKTYRCEKCRIQIIDENDVK